MGSMYPDQLSLTHYNMFYTGATPDSDLSGYSESEKQLFKRFSEIKDTEFGYLIIQTTKVSVPRGHRFVKVVLTT